MKRLLIIGFVIVLIGVIGYSCEIASADGSYNTETGEILLSDDATPYEIAHETGHQFYFEVMNQGERNRWESQFFPGSLNYCYGWYAFTYENIRTQAVECFADLYASIQGEQLEPKYQMYWYGEDGKQSKEHLAVLSLLNTK